MRLIYALNSRLPRDIAVFQAFDMPEDFHARYSCKGKEYIYKIWNSRIREPFLEGRALHYWYDMDIESMQKACEYIKGTHDFTSFCTVDKSREIGDFHRTVTELDVVREGSLVTVKIQADGFLYNMVRIIVGTLLNVSEGKFKPSDMNDIINALDRTKAGAKVPAHGLYLNKVIY